MTLMPSVLIKGDGLAEYDIIRDGLETLVGLDDVVDKGDYRRLRVTSAPLKIVTRNSLQAGLSARSVTVPADAVYVTVGDSSVPIMACRPGSALWYYPDTAIVVDSRQCGCYTSD